MYTTDQLNGFRGELLDILEAVRLGTLNFRDVGICNRLDGISADMFEDLIHDIGYETDRHGYIWGREEYFNSIDLWVGESGKRRIELIDKLLAHIDALTQELSARKYIVVGVKPKRK